MSLVRKNIVEMVRKAFGADEANLLELLADMTTEQKAAFLRMLDVFAKRPSAASQFERDATSIAATPAVRSVAGPRKK